MAHLTVHTHSRIAKPRKVKNEWRTLRCRLISESENLVLFRTGGESTGAHSSCVRETYVFELQNEWRTLAHSFWHREAYVFEFQNEWRTFRRTLILE